MKRVTGIGGIFIKSENPAAGADIDPKREDADYGRFAWFADPEGNKIELWEPPKG